jgi:hypothetical protein
VQGPDFKTPVPPKRKKKSERYQINDLMMHLNLLEKQEQTVPKINKRKEIRLELKLMQRN